MPKQKHIVSGIQPTGSLNIGTYLGGIRNFIRLQEQYADHHFFIFIADLHSITLPIEKRILRQKTKELAALYLASGLKRENLSLFIQSEIPAHAEMNYLLQCFTYVGELERMTQYKDKAQKATEGIPSSLLTYPVLQAADILLYDASYVPVGEDQKQHLELTRDIARRINNRYGDFFTVPEPLIPEIGARVMSLTDPLKKMSKSDTNEKSRVNLLDPDNIIKKRIMSAVTDSEPTIRFDPEEKPGLSNLLTMFAALEEVKVETIVSRYEDKDYKTLKEDLAERLVKEIAPIRERYHELVDSEELDRIFDEGRARAEILAARKVAKLKEKIGLGRKKK